MRCGKCQGTGFYLDFGMMQQDCDCADQKPVVIDKTSKAYRDSIAKIMKANKCNRSEAEKVFEIEFQKIA